MLNILFIRVIYTFWQLDHKHTIDERSEKHADGKIPVISHDPIQIFRNDGKVKKS